MQIFNESELTVGVLPGRVHYPKRTATLIVKGTFDLVPDGAAQLAEEQQYTSGDIPFEGGEESGELQYESDFAFFKPAADLLLVGTCHPPRPPVDRSHVRFEVGDHGRELQVFGDRTLVSSVFKKTLSDPAKFDEMPIRYSRAFGSASDEFNPAGRGAEMREKRQKSDPPVFLPNILDPDFPVTGWKDEPPPAAFAPLGRMWALRRSHGGTYDDVWLDSRWPWFPEDFDWAHFNAAPPEMQVPGYLRGDESVVLENLVADHPLFESRLPGLTVRCFWNRKGQPPTDADELRMNLDTLWIDADTLQLVLLWRGVEVVESEEFDDVELAYVAVEPLDQPLAGGEYRQRLAAVLAPTPEVDAPDESTTSEAESAANEETGVPDETPEPEIGAETQAMFDEIGKTPEEIIAELAAKYPAPDEPAEEPGDDPEPWDAARLCAAREAHEDLRELPLAGLDLSGCDLSGVDLSRSNLGGANLTGTNLTGAILTGCDLRNARLVETNLEDAVLTEAALEGAVFDRTRMQGADITEVQAPGGHWVGVDLTDATATRVILTGAQFVDVELQDCDLREADLTGTSWKDCRLFDADLGEARLDDASFAGCNLHRCVIEEVRAPRISLSDCDLTGLRASEGSDFTDARFDSCEGPGSIWSESILEGADLSGSNWREANFSKIRGERVQFIGAELRESRFIGANLCESRFDGANLFRAILERAEFTDANLQHANLYEAGLMEADLSGANLRGANTGMTLLETRGKTT